MQEVNRRQFFRSSSGILIASWASHVSAQDYFTFVPDIQYRTEGFNDDQTRLIRESLVVLKERFGSGKMRAYIRQEKKSERVMISPDYIKAIGMPEDSHKDDLLEYQLYYLSIKFPIINIKAFFSEGSTWGYAYMNIVKTTHAAKRKEDITGEFEVYLNRYHLGASGRGSDREFWAGVIAHEMLHNLGHMHPKGDYSRELQIVRFQNAIITNGAWRDGDDDFIPACGKPG